MHLVPVNIETLRIGQPLPFPLMDKDGLLLARKDFVVESKEALADFARRGGGLYIDVADAEAQHRAYVEQLHGLVRDGKALGVIAGAQLSVNSQQARQALDEEHPDWLDLQEQGNTLLQDGYSSHFMSRLERLAGRLNRQSLRNPDGSLFALIYLSSSDVRMYSATHAMLVSVMCGIAAREVLHWPAEVEAQLCKAALTMNVAMTDVQDRLATQSDTPSAAQRAVIDAHAVKSAELLAAVGVTDATWLQAVHDHHTPLAGPLRDRSPAQQMGRLIQRADMFAARLSPRASRVPLAPAAAMQACYFDENRKIDEAGAALIKAVGIYQPGSFVRLATEEVAVVIKRGTNTTTPRVAVLINRSGLPTVEPIVRDTSVRDYRVVASVAQRDVKLKMNLERMLPFTALH